MYVYKTVALVITKQIIYVCTQSNIYVFYIYIYIPHINMLTLCVGIRRHYELHKKFVYLGFPSKCLEVTVLDELVLQSYTEKFTYNTRVCLDGI